jgi:hypothetical protein
VNREDRILCALYAAIAGLALLATWSQNLAFMALPENGGVSGFIRAAMVNPAAASLTVDLLFLTLAACVLMLVEAQRLGIRYVWAYIALSFLIAISVMFPLFLIARQRRLATLRGHG